MAVSIRWTGRQAYAHARKMCNVTIGPARAREMNKGKGISHSQIELGSESESEPLLEPDTTLLQVDGSPLKVICSEKYR